MTKRNIIADYDKQKSNKNNFTVSFLYFDQMVLSRLVIEKAILHQQ